MAGNVVPTSFSADDETEAGAVAVLVAAMGVSTGEIQTNVSPSARAGGGITPAQHGSGAGSGSQQTGSGAGAGSQQTGSGSQQTGSGAGSQQTGSGSQQTGSGAGSQQTGSGAGSQQTGSGSQQHSAFLQPNSFAKSPAWAF
jgi:hypothetical protein